MKWKCAHIVILLAILATASSCVNLRYTDYGRPFDFLKAKNTYYPSKKSIEDTAAIYLAEIPVNSEISDSNLCDNHVEPFVDLTKVLETNETLDEYEVAEAIETNSEPSKKNKLDIPALGKNISLQVPEYTKPLLLLNSSRKNASEKPPEWWTKMWKFIFKWVLIALLAFVILVALIVGIYYLVLWIGGSIAAIIVVVLLLLALQIFTDIDLFWILNYL